VRTITPRIQVSKLDQTTCLTEITSPTSHETNQTTPATGLFNYAYLCPLPPVPLFKSIAHVCTPKMAEDELSAYFASSHGMPEPCNKPPFSVFIMPLYFVFWGR
jgi:hypothetical protein